MPKLDKQERKELVTVCKGVWFLVASVGCVIKNGPSSLTSGTIDNLADKADKVQDHLTEILKEL